MAVSTAPVSAAPTGLSPKAQRAWAYLEAHERRMAERRGGIQTYRCGECKSAMFHYVPPIGLHVGRCGQCGAWQKFSTEQRQ